jgi:protein gp37
MPLRPARQDALIELVETPEAELARHEATIERGQPTFVEVGNALRAIRDGRLYHRAGYDDFDAYCRARWGYSRVHAHRQIQAARTATALPIGNRPANEAQARAFVRDRRAAASPARAEAVILDEWTALEPDIQAALIDGAPLQTTAGLNQQHTDRIEWAQWSWNPVTGCLHDCPYCYARDIADRFYPHKFVPAIVPSRLHAPRNVRVPAGAADDVGLKNIFVCSMADLFGKWVPQAWIDAVFTEVVACPQWNFLFLTKFPQRLAEQRWPANAWCGTSVDRQARVATAERAFRGVEAGIKWLSCEPLLERLTFSSLEMFDWVVIGGSTRSTQTPEFQPPWAWVRHLIEQAEAAGCKVYLKPNCTSRPREYPTGALDRVTAGR